MKSGVPCLMGANRSVWIVPYATLSQLDAVNYTANVGTVFSCDFCNGFLPHINGLRMEDCALIDISEFLSLICFLFARATAYAWGDFGLLGGNANVITRIMYQKPKNRVAQFLERLIIRLETESGFPIAPCFISSKINVLRDQLSRTVAYDPVCRF